jgi:hypothetical protein
MFIIPGGIFLYENWIVYMYTEHSRITAIINNINQDILKLKISQNFSKVMRTGVNDFTRPEVTNLI